MLQKTSSTLKISVFALFSKEIILFLNKDKLNYEDLNQKFTPFSKKTHTNSFYSSSNYKDYGKFQRN